MGAGHSSPEKALQKIVTPALTITPLTHERCMASYSLTLASELSKLPRLKVQGMSEDVLFVPDVAAIHRNEKMLTKKDMCDKLTSHYLEARQILENVSRVYEMEMEDYKGLWSHVTQKVHLESKKAREVSYYECDASAEFAELPGFTEFAKGLEKEQRNALLFQVREVLSGSKEKVICGDSLFTPDEYGRVFSRTSQFKAPTQNDCRSRKELLHLAEEKDFRITGKFVSPFSSTKSRKLKKYRPETDADVKLLRRNHERMKANYRANLQKIHKVISELVVDGQFRKVTREKLAEIKKEADKTIAAYYLGTLADFRGLLKS